jgi:putative ATPase
LSNLFPYNEPKVPSLIETIPLAERVRPKTLYEFIGQNHLLDEGKPLRAMIKSGKIFSTIFWGPPGSGKTTLARLIAALSNADFIQLNAVSSGVKDIRETEARAIKNRKHLRKPTVLFIDEIHRFNKAQQDALLRSVEEGILILIGATTENPSFEIIPPLLSRCRVYVLEPLGIEELGIILQNALSKDEILSKLKIEIEDREFLYLLSGGDSRKMLNGLELGVQLAGSGKELKISNKILEEAFQRRMAMYDKEGEQHYDIISAFIKSLRGSDPDAAVYWLARMIEGGEDPKFIARRMIILASEDIGNADPYALTLAVSCFNAIDNIGMPEGRIVLAQTATYLASAPKSNASYKAIEDAIVDVRSLPNLPVPLHIRNAPTKLMEQLKFGKGYKYAHSFDGNFVEQDYLPENLSEKIYYKPTSNGAEQRIKERLMNWWKKRR